MTGSRWCDTGPEGWWALVSNEACQPPLFAMVEYVCLKLIMGAMLVALWFLLTEEDDVSAEDE